MATSNKVLLQDKDGNKYYPHTMVDVVHVDEHTTIGDWVSAKGTQLTDVATNATTQANYAKTQGDYAKAQADSIATIATNVTNKVKVNDVATNVNFIGDATGIKSINEADLVADSSITPLKTTFFKTTKNLFNKNTATTGYYVSNTTGQLSSNISYCASDYIPVDENASYVQNQNLYTAFYDKNKNHIGGLGLVSSDIARTFVTPLNTSFIRITVIKNKIDIAQLEKGTVLTDYEEYKEPYFDIKYINDSSLTGDKLANYSIPREKLSFDLPTVIKGKNLFNKTNATNGYYVNQTTGALNANAAHTVSEFIKVSPNTNYALNLTSCRIAFYNVNQAYLSGLMTSSNLIQTPENCVYVRISKETFSIDLMQFELGETPTSYEQYGYRFENYIKTDENAYIINLPQKLYALVGQEFNIYFDNIISGKDTDYTFDVVCNKGMQLERCFRFVPTIAESVPITINVYSNDKLVVSAKSTIIVSSKNAGSGVTKKIIVIGDSTTNSGICISKLNENFSTDVMSITTLGTRGSGINKHEGRSGWTAKAYVSTSADSEAINAFYNPQSSTFDFSYYLQNSNIEMPDYIIINLGINDTFNYSTDETLYSEMENILARYNIMTDGIHQVNPNIKIGIVLTIPPNYSQDAFGKVYGSNQTRARYKRNNILWVKKLIQVYENRESENLYLVPMYCNLDTKYNFGLEEIQVNARNTITYSSPIGNGGVHPVESGYWQCADSYWYFLKSFEV